MKDNIKKAKNGTYYFRVNVGYDANGKKIQKYKSGFKTKKEAKEEYANILLTTSTEINEDEVLDMKFGQFIEDIFLPWYKTQVSERTYRARVNSINVNFKYFNKYTVKQIKVIHVQKWQIKLMQDFKSLYARALFSLFSRAMDRAIVIGIINENPAKKVGSIKKIKPKIEFWTKEEFQMVLKQLNINDYYEHCLFVILWLLFMTGMRSGEAYALQWEDINFEDKYLSVTKGIYYLNVNKFVFNEPKTRSSIRDIALDDDTLQVLKTWKQKQASVVTTDFVLSYTGLPIVKSTILREIDRISKLAGVHRITVHALRHSHASLLISMGQNPLLIKDRLGHADIQTTLGTYGHLYPNMNFELAEKLQGILEIQIKNE